MRIRISPLWLIGGAFVVLAVGYSLITPLLETPDELWHYYFVREVGQYHGLLVQNAPTATSLAAESGQPPLYYVLGGLATTWIDARDFESIIHRNPNAGFDEQALDNRNIYLHGNNEFVPWQGAVLAMHISRLVSVLTGLLAVGATYRLAQALFPQRPDWAVGGAAFVAFLPQFGFVSGAV